MSFTFKPMYRVGLRKRFTKREIERSLRAGNDYRAAKLLSSMGLGKVYPASVRYWRLNELTS